MTFKILTAATLSLTLFSCASTHPGTTGKSRTEPTKIPITISAQTIDNPDGETFELVEVTIENKSEDWVRINHTEVVISNPAESKLSIVMDNDLRDWSEAMAARMRKDSYNQQLLQAGLILAGVATAASGGKGSTLATVGGITVVGTYGWAVGDALEQSYNTATGVDKIPSNHLYRSYSVPGKMFIRRWVLINKPSKVVIKNLVLKIETVDGEKEYYDIPL